MPRSHDTRTGTTAGRPAPASRRRALRREAPSTVGLLADAGDFAAMRGYRSFTFDDHRDYLHHVDGLLRSLTAQGIHTTVALFDPGEYAEYCAEHGIDPDTPEGRTRFTAELAGTGAALPHAGRSVDELAPLLVEEAVRQATWEYAAGLLTAVGSCADCGEDIGTASLRRAADALDRLVGRAGPGPPPQGGRRPTQGGQRVAARHPPTPAARS
ncbi:hypothetical protein, partial [Streptomyces sp. NPDC054961]